MIRLTIPFTDENEIREIAKVLESGYLTQGPKTAEFESKVAGLIGVKYAFAMSSGTTALHLALVVLGIQPGDEVLVADFTFPATANVVAQLGAIPVLVDIDLETFTMSPEDLLRKITSQTKAIIPVDAFGCAADYDPILEIAAQHNLSVIEDAATTLGAKYYDRYCGNLTTLGCFSFHPRKIITTGEGGMITTNLPELAEKISLLRNHGGVKIGNHTQYEASGFNYRLSDLHSAMGVVQMDKLPATIARKRDLAAALTKRLASIPGLNLPSEPRWGGHIYQSYVILLPEGLDRDQVITEMKARGVETTIGTYALHDQPFFQRQYGYKSGQLPHSHTAFTRGLALPLYPQLTEADLDLVASALRKVIQSHVN
ncbi:MAG: DegT/DnrJ/EryC1/StrS family aminotransferase [Chloroflexota bacterium]